MERMRHPAMRLRLGPKNRDVEWTGVSSAFLYEYCDDGNGVPNLCFGVR
jgi:hypothetical protein